MSIDRRDQLLAELLDEMTRGARNGKSVDLQAVCEAHPELEQELRELWGAVMVADAVAMRSNSASLDETSPVPTSVDAKELELPARFGDYQLLKELGRGGMGVVYRARQISLDRIVAIKLILRGDLATDLEQARFRSEAEAIALLEHPNIVPIFEVGAQRGRLYFSMRYIQGETLETRLQRGPLPDREAARLLLQIARATHYAHAQNVLHRDIKPANILIDRDGSPFITDFGLAKRIGDDAGLTRTGAVLGTPSYMAPEQAAGSRGKIGPAADVYSLGALLYAMLTGRPPFQAASPVDTVLMVLEQDPLPPRLLNARADRDLEMIALRCLQKPPELRYSSAAALADDLQAFLAGEAISARSGQFAQVVARMFRETHHATVLENWGLLWMWHALVLLVMCLVTNLMQRAGLATPLPYLALWGGGLAIWVPIFWALRRRAGPVTFVERQIAHIWGGSVICAILLYLLEYLMGMPVLSLSPILGLTSGMVFIVKASILGGRFYLPAAALFATSIVMAVLQYHEIHIGISLFGIVSALTFFLPGLKYYRQRQQSRHEAGAAEA